VNNAPILDADRFRFEGGVMQWRAWRVYVGSGGYADWTIERIENQFGEVAYRLTRVNDGAVPEVLVVTVAEIEALHCRTNFAAARLWRRPSQ
jgi:hypothetical protein